ncbi:hypothetical protein GCM10023205_46830 [Yinghuangia aomiensis]|uniref:Uncharacterized protein n=1 Tax=Yinghuangia aomiensis TaxID=676205 RepID=A0ABP9HNS4_9ACTN
MAFPSGLAERGCGPPVPAVRVERLRSGLTVDDAVEAADTHNRTKAGESARDHAPFEP